MSKNVPAEGECFVALPTQQMPTTLYRAFRPLDLNRGTKIIPSPCVLQVLPCLLQRFIHRSCEISPWMIHVDVFSRTLGLRSLEVLTAALHASSFLNSAPAVPTHSPLDLLQTLMVTALPRMGASASCLMISSIVVMVPSVGRPKILTIFAISLRCPFIGASRYILVTFFSDCIS